MISVIPSLIAFPTAMIRPFRQRKDKQHNLNFALHVYFIQGADIKPEMIDFIETYHLTLRTRQLLNN